MTEQELKVIAERLIADAIADIERMTIREGLPDDLTFDARQAAAVSVAELIDNADVQITFADGGETT